MQVRYVFSELLIDGDPRTRLVVQGDGIETEILGWGEATYKITIRACANEEEPGADRYNAIMEFLSNHPTAIDAAWWGQGLVWATPHTIAHLVRDVIREQ